VTTRDLVALGIEIQKGEKKRDVLLDGQIVEGAGVRKAVLMNSLLADFFVGLGARELDKTYDNPWIVRSFFRFVSPLAQEYIMRLFSAIDGTRVESLSPWVKSDQLSQKMHFEALTQLNRLRIIQSGFGQDGSVRYYGQAFHQRDVRKTRYIRMNPLFRDQLRVALCGSARARLPLLASRLCD